MFHVSFNMNYYSEAQIAAMNDEANSLITTRGTSERARIDSDLSDPKWFLSVSDIAYNYCSTNRYLFFKKVEDKKPEPTWASYKGRVLDELIPDIFDRAKKYASQKKLRKFMIYDDLMNYYSDSLTKKQESLNIADFIDSPEAADVDSFFKDIYKLIFYELHITSSFLSYRISNNYDINLGTDFNILFPFNFKLKMNGIKLGIAESAEIDFIFKDSILGEIKSDKWHDFYNVGLAGYALAFEVDRLKPVNLGLIVCPLFLEERTVPMFKTYSSITIIDEVYRKIFLSNRNNRIELVKNKVDPGPHDKREDCSGCGYYRECWAE